MKRLLASVRARLYAYRLVRQLRHNYGIELIAADRLAAELHTAQWPRVRRRPALRLVRT